MFFSGGFKGFFLVVLKVLLWWFYRFYGGFKGVVLVVL